MHDENDEKNEIVVEEILNHLSMVVKNIMRLTTIMKCVYLPMNNLLMKESKLDLDTFNGFISLVDKARQQFCIYIEFNNKTVEYYKYIYSPTSNRLLKHNYNNFFEVTRNALQLSSLLSAAKLIDPAFHNNRPKNPARFSIYYIFHILWDVSLSDDFENWLDKDFIKSLKKIRRESIAHNDLELEKWILKWWVEGFFELLVETIEIIKTKNTALRAAQKIVLSDILSSSETWVQRLFQKLN